MSKKVMVKNVLFQSDADPEFSWVSRAISVVENTGRPLSTMREMRAAMLPEYEDMCDAIDSAMDTDVLLAWIDAIELIESGGATEIEKSTEGWLVEISVDSVRFYGQFGQGNGGEVPLSIFKIAVQAYIRFLSDPEMRAVEVVL